jgi:hypothetical protein
MGQKQKHIICKNFLNYVLVYLSTQQTVIRLCVCARSREDSACVDERGEV